MTYVALGFIPKPLSIELENLLPSRRLPMGLTATQKFKQISASIKEVGLIEPLSITAVDRASGKHLLLDGHVRLIALRALGQAEAPCLVATDDEAYTYNNRINRISTIQEHLMIRRAVERGVSRERLADTLCVDIGYITRKMTILDGICREAIELLKDRNFSVEMSRVLRRMKPTRQVECAELMIEANNLSFPYAQALLAATPAELMVGGKKPTKLAGVSHEQMLHMEKEMGSLQSQYRLVEESYGDDMLIFVIARGYLAKLLDNKHVVRYLQVNQSDILDQFKAVVATASLEV